MNCLFDKRLVIGIGLIVALLILSSALTYRNTQRLNEDAGSVVYSHEILDLTFDVMLALLDAETGERGFLVTGKEPFLEPYHAALARLDELIAALKGKTKENARQQAWIQGLEERSRERVEQMKKSIDMRRRGERNVQVYFAIYYEGKTTMDSLRELIAAMQADEHRLLQDRERRSKRAYRVAVTTGLLTALVGLIFVGAFVWLLGRSLSDRQKGEQALRDADRRKNEFLAALAHELRNPLAPIRNAVEILRHTSGNGDLKEQVRGMMERQVGQMARLIDDLLDISRIAQGKVQVRKQRIDLAEAVQLALEAARPHIEASAHELSVQMPPEPICLEADANRLAQVISNLLNNAARYTEKGGRIWLTVQQQGGEAVVAVRDSGIGIAAEHLARIFDTFFQVGPDLQGSRAGLGIGLALVRGLVELHGGRVEAHSDGIGRGSEFLVRLPIVEVPH